MEKPQSPKLYTPFQTLKTAAFYILIGIILQIYNSYGFVAIAIFYLCFLLVALALRKILPHIKFIQSIRQAFSAYELAITEYDDWHENQRKIAKAKEKPQNIDENIAKYKTEQKRKKLNRKWWHIY